MITTPNGVKCIGYTDLNSRLASTSSSLYANNQQKWIAAAGPTTTPAWEAAATRLRARAVCGPLTMSVAADCATGIDAAKTPAHSRPMRMPEVEPEAAMRRLEAVAPVRQTRRMIARPWPTIGWGWRSYG